MLAPVISIVVVHTADSIAALIIVSAKLKETGYDTSEATTALTDFVFLVPIKRSSLECIKHVSFHLYQANHFVFTFALFFQADFLIGILEVLVELVHD